MVEKIQTDVDRLLLISKLEHSSFLHTLGRKHYSNINGLLEATIFGK